VDFLGRKAENVVFELQLFKHPLLKNGEHQRVPRG
jgi:hypothetical protein